MKQIDNYILEKLKINKDSKVEVDSKMLKEYEKLTMYFSDEMLNYLDDTFGNDLESKYNAAYFYDKAYLTYDSDYKDPTKIWVVNYSDKSYDCFYGDKSHKSRLGLVNKLASEKELKKLGWLKK